MIPEDIRALVVLIGLLGVATFLCLKFLGSEFSKDIQLYAGFTGAVLVAAVLINNIWILFAALATLSFIAARLTENKLGFFIVAMVALPLISRDLSGFGLVGKLFNLSTVFILTVTVLLPYIAKRAGAGIFKYGAANVRLVAIAPAIWAVYLAFVALFGHDSVTGGMRGLFQNFFDIFLLFFAFALARDGAEFRRILAGLLFAGLFLAVVAIFEHFKGWLLYASFSRAFGSGLHAYQSRGEWLRAVGSPGHGIALGFLIGAFLWACLYWVIEKGRGLFPLIVLGIFVIGLWAPVSRGPWVGAFAGFLAYLYLTKGISGLVPVLFAGLALSVILPNVFGIGKSTLDFLPWVQGQEGAISFTDSYRTILNQRGLEFIFQHPLLGSVNFTEHPLFDPVRYGTPTSLFGGGPGYAVGFVDVVNSYLGVAGMSGIPGFLIFCTALFGSTWLAFRAARLYRKTRAEIHLFAVMVTCMLVTLAVTIYTTSSISFIAPLTWILIGLGVSVHRLSMQPQAFAYGQENAYPENQYPRNRLAYRP
jgi:hypothetical protein